MSPELARSDLEDPAFYYMALPVFTILFIREHILKTRATSLFLNNLEFWLKKRKIILSPVTHLIIPCIFEEEEELNSRNKEDSRLPSTSYEEENESHGCIHIQSCSESFLYPCPQGIMSYL